MDSTIKPRLSRSKPSTSCFINCNDGKLNVQYTHTERYNITNELSDGLGHSKSSIEALRKTNVNGQTQTEVTQNDSACEKTSISSLEDLCKKSSTICSSISKDQCRICYQTASENVQSGDLVPCGCKCTGTAQYVHRLCMQEWIDFQGSNICEICGSKMNFNVTSYSRQPTRLNYDGGFVLQLPNNRRLQRMGGVIRQDYIQLVHSERKRLNSPRFWLASIFILMILATASSATSTVYSHKNLEVKTSASRLDMPLGSLDKPEVEKLHMSYGLSLAIFVFCATFTVAVGLLWFCVELYIISKPSDDHIVRNTSTQESEENNNRNFMLNV